MESTGPLGHRGAPERCMGEARVQRGGHLSKTPGGSVVQWRGRAADPTVEREHKMSLTSSLSDPPHGKEVHHSHRPTTGALRKGRGLDPARGGYLMIACPPQTLHQIMAIINLPGESDLSFSVFPGHLLKETFPVKSSSPEKGGSKEANTTTFTPQRRWQWQQVFKRLGHRQRTGGISPVPENTQVRYLPYSTIRRGLMMMIKR
ncbi:unnamed protein product [Pleuronectes platessa]|uniref:Uncharacterized protein n=1 Tax=Pleuronectes platessa TaxID=8262 RepID=A0A9N7TYF4_PLEPL|nr:unnamed protein product [Pleuronectes platessa]